MRRRNGHFSSDPLEIAIARSLCLEAMAGEAERTLRHEMIHLWQWKNGVKVGHGKEFRRWAERLEIHPRATRSVCWLSGA
jgi:predicted SprT family Zn-dependent metalloprotease